LHLGLQKCNHFQMKAIAERVTQSAELRKCRNIGIFDIQRVAIGLHLGLQKSCIKGCKGCIMVAFRIKMVAFVTCIKQKRAVNIPIVLIFTLA